MSITEIEVCNELYAGTPLGFQQQACDLREGKIRIGVVRRRLLTKGHRELYKALGSRHGRWSLYFALRRLRCHGLVFRTKGFSRYFYTINVHRFVELAERLYGQR